jgi:hypothetical protein
MSNKFDFPLESVVWKSKIDPYSGGREPKGEPRESRGRPRRCNRGRNLPDPLSWALSMLKGQRMGRGKEAWSTGRLQATVGWSVSQKTRLNALHNRSSVEGCEGWRRKKPSLSSEGWVFYFSGDEKTNFKCHGKLESEGLCVDLIRTPSSSHFHCFHLILRY